MAMAVPLCSRGIKSAIVPPPNTIGAPPTAAFLSVNACNHRVFGFPTAHHKPEHYEHAHVCRDGGCNGKNDEEQVARMI